ncbi:MAG: hypothetical protein GXX96_18095 [Planctomycetaceae bacterium]|nr:hypothetical protein [Planctomycetaceae bacterium]
MELKNAVAVCLISLFSATLVVLIARALDNQAASQLEPQLAQIVEELRAIRTQGGVSLSGGPAAETLDDGLIVYYFHGNVRCPTCRAIESQAHEVVANDFADQLASGRVAWKIVNYDKPEGTDLAKQFDVHMANVVLAQMDGGEIKNWRRLDQVWALVGDKPAFAEFIRTETGQMLAEDEVPADSAGAPDLLDLPVPEMSPPPLPQSDAPADLPLPE